MKEFTKVQHQEIKILRDVWEVLERHGLKSDYCSHCNQFAIAKKFQKQDETISAMYEALKAIIDAKALHKTDPLREQASKALAQAEEKL